MPMSERCPPVYLCTDPYADNMGASAGSSSSFRLGRPDRIFTCVARWLLVDREGAERPVMACLSGGGDGSAPLPAYRSTDW